MVLMLFKLLSAFSFILDQSKNCSSGNGLKGTTDTVESQKLNLSTFELR